MILDHAQLRALLPHRHPMLLLDSVIAVEPGVSLAAVKAISACEPCYGDLPDGCRGASYAYPASLLIESFGQAAAVLWLLSARAAGRAAEGLPMFTAARDCALWSPAYPGDVVRHQVLLDHAVDGAAFVTGESFVGQRCVAEFGSLMAVVRPPDAVLARAGAATGTGKDPLERREHERVRPAPGAAA